MKRSIIVAGFITMICIARLKAMEMEVEQLFQQTASTNSTYGSLIENVLYSIQEQRYSLSEPVKQIQNLPNVLSFSLSDMRNQFCIMSDDCKRAVIKAMSTQLLFLSCIAICLPEDVVKNHICLPMMDGVLSCNLSQNKINIAKRKIRESAEDFYSMPIAQAFGWYYINKESQIDTTKPIGLSYVLFQSEKDLLSQLRSSWYCSAPIVSQATKESFDKARDVFKRFFLQGQEIVVVSDDENNMCAPKTACRNCIIGLCCASCTFGAATGIWWSIAQVLGGSSACELGPLAINGVCAGCALLCVSSCMINDQRCSCCYERTVL